MEELEKYRQSLFGIDFKSIEHKMRFRVTRAVITACQRSGAYVALYHAFAKGDRISTHEATRRAACIECQGSSDCGDCINEEKGK